jgi:hypothetical protein
MTVQGRTTAILIPPSGLDDDRTFSQPVSSGERLYRADATSSIPDVCHRFGRFAVDRDPSSAR